MKKIFCLLLFGLLEQTLWAQSGEGYNPVNPADPDVYYTLTLETSPYAGGTISQDKKVLSAGQSTYVSASPRLGYEFKRWMMGDSVVSTYSSFYFTMPEKDVVLTAYFDWNPEYNPQNPGDPDADGYSHHVYAYAMPSAGGYFNSSSFTLIEGSTTNIYAYPREGYRFESWMCNGEVVSTDNPLSIKMGTADIAYTATFVYNPVSPGDPSPNVFNAATGEVVIDNFTSGSLNNTIYSLVGSGNYDKVQSILVIGRMQSSDFGFARSYRNCSLIDLSRTTGYTEVPSWSFERAEALKEIFLPMNIERIGENAFNGCSTLKDIYLYATTPPILAANALYGLDKSVTIHVPSASLALYSAAAGWNQLTIQSLDENEKSITVRLPGEAGEYKNMTLELQNMQSGQVYRCLVTDRTNYTFFGLMKNTYYNIYLKNSSGVVLGEINNVALENDNLNVNLSNIHTTHDVTLNVVTPDDRNVTSDVAITWLDEQGSYLRQGNKVSELLTGTRIQYRVKLSKELAMEYVQPVDEAYEVTDGDNAITMTLAPIKQIAMSGYVKDAATKQGISGATVSISQTLNGKYSKTIIAKTDSKGYYTATVYNAPTSLAISAYDYVNQTAEVNIEPASESVTVDDIAMTSIIGATINVNLTYTPSVDEGETAETQNWYDDYQNVAYSIYNMTTGKEVTQVSNRYPQLVILDGAKAGDELRITATSKKDMFMPVTVVGAVDSTNRVDLSVPIIQYGGIRTTFERSTNSEVVGILYDGKGYLINVFDYNEDAVLSIPELKDGEYTLITMGKDSYFNSIYNLTQLPNVGLIEKVDYCRNDFAVTSGVTQGANAGIVPELDTSKYKYIGDGTTFTVNKTSIVAGNYLTFSSSVDFFGEYVSAISGVELIVDIPESASFVDKSLLVGSSASEYSLEGNRITIPLNNYHRKDKVRFCVIPKEKGSYAPSAFVRFVVDNKEKIVAIGAARYEVESLSIIVPKTVTKKEVIVRGASLPGSKVEIYDNDIMIAQLETPADGSWNVSCELANAYNLSTHPIYAKVTTGDAEVFSETQECYYDVSANGVKTVTMTHYNAYYKRNMDVVFDMESGTTTPSFYYFYTAADYSFIVDFINNDTSAVSNVSVYAFDYNGKATRMTASYDSKTNKWVAKHNFSSSNAPVNVSVDYVHNSVLFGDEQQLKSDMNEVEDAFNSWKTALTELDTGLDNHDVPLSNSEIYNELEALVSQDNYDSNRAKELIAMLIASTPAYEQTELEDVTDEEYEKERNEVEQLYSSLITDGKESLLESLLINRNIFDGNYAIEPVVYQSEGNEYQLSVKLLTSVNESSLAEQGYIALTMTDASIIWSKISDNSISFIDPVRKMEITKDFNNTNGSRRAKKAISDIPTSCIDATSGLIGLFRDDDNIETWRHNCDVAKSIMDGISCFYELVYNNATKNDLLDQLQALRNAEKGRYDAWLTFISEKKVIPPSDIKHLRGIGNSLSKIDNSIKELQDFMNGPIQRLLSRLPNRLTENLPRLGNTTTSLGRIAGGFGILINLYDAYCDSKDAVKDIESWIRLREAIERKIPCEGEEAKALELRRNIISDARALQNNWVRIISAKETALVADAVSLKTWKSPIVTLGLYVGSIYLNLYTELSKALSIDGKFLNLKTRYWYEVGMLKCNKKDPEPPKPNNEPTTINWDPSGYVYEGVSSNRLQGVTATCYYMETTEDMYGVLHDEPKVWDAEEYAQENPLFTDENGMYQWDVPQGLWQVKFEKEGYETTYSEWLPVPPPQLEVNIGMVQSRQPDVKQTHAYKDGIEVEFDKYMLPTLLNTENILVSQNGEYVEGEVKLQNEETAYADDNVKYASKIRFVPTTPFTASEVTLTVSNRVKSYAGLQMQDSYQQTFDIEQEIKEIVLDDTLKVESGKKRNVSIQVLPKEAAIGKTMKAATSAEMITAIENAETVIDENGMATFSLSGELPGTAAVTYSVEGYDLEARQVINVNITDGNAPVVAVPIASIASGSSIYEGTSVSLSTTEPESKIYYTLDGSCPCDNTSRILYEGPITINSDVTVKAMTLASDETESDVVTYVYSILQNNAGVSLNNGWNWVSFNMKSDALANVNSAMTSGVWTVDDEIKNDKYSDSYSVAQNKWFGTLSKQGGIKNEEMYKIHSSQNQTLSLAGNAVNPSDNAITVKAGWNYIGYLPMANISLADALTDYNALAGDVIKSQDAFATYSTTNGWEGDLTTMEVGRGYMLKRNAESGQTSFHYPVVYSNSSSARKATLHYDFPDNMNVIGEVCGVNPQVGDSILALVGAQTRGAGVVDENGKVYLTIQGDDRAKATIVLQRKGEIVATANAPIMYQSNMVLGTVEKPTKLEFVDNPTETNLGKIRAIYNTNGTLMKTKELSRVPVGTYIIYSNVDGRDIISKYFKKQ